MDTEFILAITLLVFLTLMFSSLVIGLVIEVVKYEIDKRKKLDRQRAKD